jgi:hypothetical protein
MYGSIHPKQHDPTKTLFKLYMASCLRRLSQHRALWRYLRDQAQVRQACELDLLPDRRTSERRLKDFAAIAEVQIQALGLVLCLEQVTDATHAATDARQIAPGGPSSRLDSILILWLGVWL